MKQGFKLLDNIREKTIVITCKDSLYMNNFIKNNNIILCTFFNEIALKENSLDLAYFNYCITEENVKKVIITGHYDCSERLYPLQKEKNIIKQLKKLNNYPFSRINYNNPKLIIWLDVINKMNTLLKMETIIDNDVLVKGMIINEKQNYAVEEINF